MATKTKKNKTPHLPVKGAITGYKYLRVKGGYVQCRLAIATLRIPAKAERCMGTDEDNREKYRKCRASEAKVVALRTLRRSDWKRGATVRSAYSTHNNDFKYKAGIVVRPEWNYERAKYITCGSGIHFFMTLEQAIFYAKNYG